MPRYPLLLLSGITVLLLSACDKALPEAGDQTPTAAVAEVDAAGTAGSTGIVVVTDPVRDEIWNFKLRVRQHLNNREFKQLEEIAAQLRKEQSLFDNGSWKIVQFYESLLPARKESDSLWELHEAIRSDWMEQYPESITAKVAMMDFLNSYAWRARGGDWAHKVKKEAWPVFGERLKRSFEVARSAGDLRVQDPVFYRECLTIALGLSMDEAYFDEIVAEAHRLYPTFWGTDTFRAHSLLPRWLGEEGDWEAFALETASRPDGLQDELYARIVVFMNGYYDNVFIDTDAQWEKTRNGLDILVEKYPRSVSLTTQAAKMAILANDREAAARYFARLDNRYLKNAWKSEAAFRKHQRWANAAVDEPAAD